MKKNFEPDRFHVLETLRKDLIAAFYSYSRRQGEMREAEWQNYVLLREGYLREKSGERYLPLKPILIFEELDVIRAKNQAIL